LFMLWQWDKRAFRIGAFLIFEVVGFLLWYVDDGCGNWTKDLSICQL
jgi:hypothetical protein